MSVEIEYYKNIKSNLIFIIIDGENLINPMGKMVAYTDLYEPVPASPEKLSSEQLTYIDKQINKEDAAKNHETYEETKERHLLRNIRERIEYAFSIGSFVNFSNLCNPKTGWKAKDLRRAIAGKYETIYIKKITKNNKITPKRYICKIGDTASVLAHFEYVK